MWPPPSLRLTASHSHTPSLRVCWVYTAASIDIPGCVQPRSGAVVCAAARQISWNHLLHGLVGCVAASGRLGASVASLKRGRLRAPPPLPPNQLCLRQTVSALWVLGGVPRCASLAWAYSSIHVGPQTYAVCFDEGQRDFAPSLHSSIPLCLHPFPPFVSHSLIPSPSVPLP